MKKRMKRILSFMLTVVLVFGMISMNTYATSGVKNIKGETVTLKDDEVLPTATVKNLGPMTISEGSYMTYQGSSTGDMPLSFVMQFVANQSVEAARSGSFAEWYADFVITFDGIESSSFVADGCYLAGYYGTFGWVKVPVDEMTIEEGVRYPVMLGVGFGQKYDYICEGVQDFLCAMYLTPEVLAANPNIKVTLADDKTKFTKSYVSANEFIEK